VLQACWTPLLLLLSMTLMLPLLTISTF